MAAVWQVQEAKNRFSELIEQALKNGPQVITRHGRAVARVVAAGQSDPAITAPTRTAGLGMTAADGFANYLLTAPRGDRLEAPARRSRKSVLVLGG